MLHARSLPARPCLPDRRLGKPHEKSKSSAFAATTVFAKKMTDNVTLISTMPELALANISDETNDKMVGCCSVV